MAQVETERFILRPFEEGDIDFLNELHSDEKVMQYILGRVRSHDENMTYLERLITLEKEQGIGQRIVIQKSNQKPVGRCGISLFYGLEKQGFMSYKLNPKEFPPEENKEENEDIKTVYELGYTFLQETWGKGYASETAIAMRDYALQEQKLPEIHSIIMQENLASIKVAEKIGAQRLAPCLCLGEIGWDYISVL